MSRPARSSGVWVLLGILACTAGSPARGTEEGQRGGRRNVLLLLIDDLRPELRCFGAEYIHSPNIDRLAAQGRPFRRHYVQAPTCGASRASLLTGRYGGSGNGALFQRARRVNLAAPSMPAWFRRHGYTTVSIGKVSHHPGGRGGSDWNDPSQPEMPHSWDRHLAPSGAWQHPRGAMHGLAHGEIRHRAGDMDVFQSVEGTDLTYPDGLTTAAALRELDDLAAAGRPFFLAVGILRPHLPFGAPAQYMRPYEGVELPEIPHAEKPTGRTTWHGSGEFMKYNRWQRDPREDAALADEVRRHYAACVSYADALVGRILAHLKRRGLDENTIVMLWGDHGWHLGEHAIWGKHSLFEESLRSPLIIRAPEVERRGVPTERFVETIDIFPTLCELASIPVSRDAQGSSLLPLLRDPLAKQGADELAVAYTGRAQTIRDPRYRLIRHAARRKEPAPWYELYDHASPRGETANVAATHPEIVERLEKELERRVELLRGKQRD